MKIERHFISGEFANIFTMNAWSENMSENERNTIVATALNNCVEHNGLLIFGYLLMNRCLFLVGFSKDGKVDKLLEIFYKEVAIEIRKYHSEKNRKYEQENIPVLKTGSHEHLFLKYKFRDYYMKDLIMGKKVELPYYDPRLERLKNYIHNYNYCSAVDYAGGKSPVHVIARKNKRIS